MIVVDNESKDDTAKIAKKLGATVYSRPNNAMLNINKNYGFSKAKNSWILCLDADERLTPELSTEIKKRINSGSKDVEGYWISRKNIIFGKWIQNSIWWPDYHLRLFQKGKGKFPEVHVHEHIIVDGQTERLIEPFVHEHYDTVSQYIQKMDTIYTENEASLFIKDGKKVQWFDAIRFPVHDFLKTFFLQKGYKDGLHGLILSILQAFYMEVVFIKVWEKQGRFEVDQRNFLQDMYAECKKLSYEFQYWFYTACLNETKSPLRKSFYRLLRKRITRKLSMHE